MTPRLILIPLMVLIGLANATMAWAQDKQGNRNCLMTHCTGTRQFHAAPAAPV